MSKIELLKAAATDNVLGMDILNANRFAELIIQECAVVADRAVEYGRPSEDILNHFEMEP
jgi:hypothetical protein